MRKFASDHGFGGTNRTGTAAVQPSSKPRSRGWSRTAARTWSCWSPVTARQRKGTERDAEGTVEAEAEGGVQVRDRLLLLGPLRDRRVHDQYGVRWSAPPRRRTS